MIYIDASFYLALLNSKDSNHQKAKNLAQKHSAKQLVTSQIIIGETLTVGSMRINKDLTLKFVDQIYNSSTQIVLESPKLVEQAYDYFSLVPSKNISWADCFSFAVINQLKINEVLTFDKDFKKYQPMYIDWE